MTAEQEAAAATPRTDPHAEPPMAPPSARSAPGSGVLAEIERRDGPAVSVEFFPPRTEAGETQLRRTIEELDRIDLAFVSVTYGAGGSTRDRTRDLVVELARTRSYPAMAHLTCIGHGKDELVRLLEDYDRHGVHDILALAGDPPADGSPAEGDFTYAIELVELVRRQGDHFTVAVAAHPELHPRSTSRSEDRRRLAEKLAVADLGITQFFFDPDDYFRMVDELAALGVDTPVHPGVMPMSNPTGVRRMAQMSGASFPEELARRVEDAAEGDRHRIVVDAAAELSARLLEGGAPGLHLYGLNRSEVVVDLVRALDLG
jgi:methylenetetrahydrofolate reductase (NADPH)